MSHIQSSPHYIRHIYLVNRKRLASNCILSWTILIKGWTIRNKGRRRKLQNYPCKQTGSYFDLNLSHFHKDST